MDWWPIFVTMQGLCICDSRRRHYLRDAILGFCAAWQVALLCPPLFVCTPSSAQERGSLCKMCMHALHISALHCVYKYFVWSVWTQVLLLLSDVCVISSLQVPPSTHQSLCRSQLWEVLRLDVYWLSNIYLAQLCEDHNSSYRFLGLGLIVSAFWSPAGFNLIILF